MKKLLFFFVVVLFPIFTFGQPKVRVSECFELTGVAFRLSGYDVFVHSEPENYVADMDAWFSKYKEHELVKFIKKTIGAKHVLEFNFITDMAADIEITPKGLFILTSGLQTMLQKIMDSAKRSGAKSS